MTWGAINEWTTQAGFARLIERANHSTLRELLKRIMNQEGGHIDFYASEATRRLSDSPRAQKLTRFALNHFWRPVGSGVMPNEEVGFLVKYLFDGSDGAEWQPASIAGLISFPAKSTSTCFKQRCQRFPAPERCLIAMFSTSNIGLVSNGY